MLEKLIIAGAIALVASAYPAYKVYKEASIPMYQNQITKTEREIAKIRLTEHDPAKRYVKVARLENKIVKLQQKIKDRKQVLELKAQWLYEDRLRELDRKKVYIDSTFKFDPK